MHTSTASLVRNCIRKSLDLTIDFEYGERRQAGALSAFFSFYLLDGYSICYLAIACPPTSTAKAHFEVDFTLINW
jgi:hypothetical protein